MLSPSKPTMSVSYFSKIPLYISKDIVTASFGSFKKRINLKSFIRTLGGRPKIISRLFFHYLTPPPPCTLFCSAVCLTDGHAS